MNTKPLTRQTVMLEIARILLEAEIERQRKLAKREKAPATKKQPAKSILPLHIKQQQVEG